MAKEDHVTIWLMSNIVAFKYVLCLPVLMQCLPANIFQYKHKTKLTSYLTQFFTSFKQAWPACKYFDVCAHTQTHTQIQWVRLTVPVSYQSCSALFSNTWISCSSTLMYTPAAKHHTKAKTKRNYSTKCNGFGSVGRTAANKKPIMVKEHLAIAVQHSPIEKTGDLGSKWNH